MDLSNNKKFKYFMAAFFLGMMSLTYYKLISHDPVLSYDDKSLLIPIQQINTMREYLENLFHGYLYDVQPIRDLSFYIDIFLMKLIPFYSHHLTNLILWLSVCFTLKKIIDFHTEDKNNTSVIFGWVILFLIAFSPVSTGAVAWISARKHILSALFILIATWKILISEKIIWQNFVFVTTMFLLACFSHPINVLWPLWAISYLKYKKNLSKNHKIEILFAVMLLCISASVVLINLNYYNEAFIQLTGGSKYDPETSGNIGMSLLAMGRYFYLVLFPFDALPTTHYQGSWQNLVGLIMFPLFIFFIFKIKDEKKRMISFLYLLFFLLPLIPVTASLTTIFCSDTYLLTAAVGIYLVIFINFQNSKVVKNLALAYVAFLFLYNLNYVNVFASDTKIWEYTSEKEPNSYSLIYLAEYYIKEKKFQEAELLIHRAKEWKPDNVYLVPAALNSIFYNTNIEIEKRIDRLEHFSPQNALSILYLSILYSNNNKPEKVRELLPGLLQDPGSYFINFNERNEETIATYFALCEKNNVKKCNESFTNLKKEIQMPHWNKQRFDEVLLKHRNNNNISY